MYISIYILSIYIYSRVYIYFSRQSKAQSWRVPRLERVENRYFWRPLVKKEQPPPIKTLDTSSLVKSVRSQPHEQSPPPPPPNSSCAPFVPPLPPRPPRPLVPCPPVPDVSTTVSRLEGTTGRRASKIDGLFCTDGGTVHLRRQRRRRR